MSRPARAAAALVIATTVLALVVVLLGVLGTVIAVPAWTLWPLAVASLLSGAAGCLVAGHTGRGPGRLFWQRVGAAVTVLAAGTCSQTFDTLHKGDELIAMGPLSGVLYLVAVTVAVGALLRLPGQVRTWRARVAMFLDIAIVGVAAALVMLQIMSIMPVPMPDGVLATAVRVIVLATASATVVAIVKAGMSGTGLVHAPSLIILSPVGALGSAALLVAPFVQPWPHLAPATIVMPAFAVLLAFATRAQTLANLAPARRETNRRDRRRSISVVPYLSVGVTATMLLGVTVHVGYLPAGHAAGTVVLILLVVVRQHTALADNRMLMDRLADQARRDELTGLPNRRAFTGALVTSAPVTGAPFTGAQQRTSATTVAVCDLDDFAALNDRLGDDAGDAVLRQAAERITLTVGGSSLVARLAGDEFGILLDGPFHPESLLDAFRAPLTIDGHDLLVTVTIGVASGTGEDVPDLLRRAELALQSAQRVGANRYEAHTDALDASAQHHAHLAAALRHGLDNNEFRLVYQPIVELPHVQIRGVEALVRWHPADGSTVSPAEFIPVAEQTGLIIDLGAWVLDTACADAAAWRHRHGDATPRVSINVSARQLLDPELPGLVAATLRRHGLQPHHLTLEITETAVFVGGAALATVHALRDLGVGIALDDFGTGHSSLTLLRTCPVTTLKVDKSFIDELNGSPEQEAIAASLRSIADTLGLGAVAEGVETQDQADRLHTLGYRYAQGFHFARPAPADHIDKALQDALLRTTY